MAMISYINAPTAIVASRRPARDHGAPHNEMGRTHRHGPFALRHKATSCSFRYARTH